MDYSGFDTAPRRILIHDPLDGEALSALRAEHLRQHNFLDLPTTERFFTQYSSFRTELAHQAELQTLEMLLGRTPEYLREASTNPNLMFTRDSSITLPWAPDLFVPARLKLAGRAGEPSLVARALMELGISSIFEFGDDEYCEGGDVLPVMDAGRRILLVGFGVRTTKVGAIRLALELIPTYADWIIGLSHDPDLLHLDAGFTVLPNRVIFAASGMFHAGFLIDECRRLNRIDPIAFAKELGFTVLTCDKIGVIRNERCNMLPLGRGRYVAFSMPAAVRAELEEKAGIAITILDGDEISKASGGVNCLTRPIYQ